MRSPREQVAGSRGPLHGTAPRGVSGLWRFARFGSRSPCGLSPFSCRASAWLCCDAGILSRTRLRMPVLRQTPPHLILSPSLYVLAHLLLAQGCGRNSVVPGRCFRPGCARARIASCYQCLGCGFLDSTPASYPLALNARERPSVRGQGIPPLVRVFQSSHRDFGSVPGMSFCPWRA